MSVSNIAVCLSYMKKVIGLFAIAAMICSPMVSFGSDHATDVKSKELSIASYDTCGYVVDACEVSVVSAPVAIITPTAYAGNVYVSTPVVNSFSTFALVPDPGSTRYRWQFNGNYSYTLFKPGKDPSITNTRISPHNKSYCNRSYNGKLDPERRTC